ncbi:hypothetical protein ACFS5N_04710 [Mucilaginibacter ximonensis]|uniref:Uncharacterized protein n=1 Tax=Mucilaginibacter ximonensis TaxID=538021 RepID=A0ABW5YAC9_9SPHI
MNIACLLQIPYSQNFAGLQLSGKNMADQHTIQYIQRVYLKAHNQVYTI